MLESQSSALKTREIAQFHKNILAKTWAHSIGVQCRAM